MMNTLNDTRTDQLLQEHLKIWDNKILPSLPENLDKLAEEKGAFQRKRGVRSVSDLLKTLFCMPARAFLSGFWQLQPSHLEFPAFQRQLGESAFPRLSLFCTVFSTACFQLFSSQPLFWTA